MTACDGEGESTGQKKKQPQVEIKTQKSSVTPGESAGEKTQLDNEGALAQRAKLLATTPLGEEYESLLTGLARDYAKNATTAGLEWLKSLPHGLENESAFSAFFNEWIQSGGGEPIANLLDICAEFQYPAFRFRAEWACLLTKWSSEPQSTWAEFQKRKTTMPRAKELEENLVRTSGGVDPGKAIQIIGDTVKSAGADSSLIRAFFEGARFNTITDACDAALALGSTYNQAVALESVVRMVKEQDLMVFSEKLNALPDKSDYGLACKALSDRLKTKSPAEAFAWAQAISEPAIRESQIIAIIKYAKRVDPATGAALEKQNIQK